MPKSSDQSTKDRLLDAAFEVIADDGWSAATTRAIARRAGVNNALVHYHFGSLEALKLASVDRARVRAIRRPLDDLDRAPRLLDGIADAIAALESPEVDQRLLRVLMVMRAQVHVDAALQEMSRARLADLRQGYAARLVDEEGVDADDAEALAALLIAALFGLYSDHLIDPDLPTAHAGRLLAELIRARTPHEERTA